MKIYKCIDCQRVFETYEDADNCIFCGSDNITPTQKVSVFWLMAIVFIVCVPIGFGIAKWSFGLSEETKVVHSGGSDVIVTLVDTVAIPRIVSVSEPKYKNGAYDFEVVAQVQTRNRLEFSLAISEDIVPDYISKDGKFTGVAPTEDGIYILKVTNIATGDIAERVLSGFTKPVQQPIVKLTKSQLQNILDTQSAPQGLYLKFADGYKMKFVDLDASEPTPDRFDEILNRLVATWSRAEVLGVQYDELNRITSITIKVVY